MSFKQQLLRYWLAMNAGVIQSTAHATKAWIAIAAMHTVDGSVPALNFTQFAVVIAFFFLQSTLDYLDKNPLPQITPK